ncbi:MAG: imidazolonepropionase [Desulfococcaceae bacterium]|jgi:imidazolonepropionase|nr:imidazolonepropionase [Desulfococcaceae bacterium]
MIHALPEKTDILFMNCHLATMAGNSLSPVCDAALALSGEKIVWTGKYSDLSEEDKTKARKCIDCKQKWILPGFVDCHTHLVWAGSRSDEFEMRLRGCSYAEISKKGGGILSTVRAVRNASEEELFSLASRRIRALFSSGVTTLEIKSGYGLSLESELKMLEVIGKMQAEFPLHIAATFLGAHALPPEYSSDSKGYMEHIIRIMLPEIKKQGIATAVDAFCETIAFSRKETASLFQKAKELDFHVKLHAEQLSDSDGAALAAEYGALSCDHLEYLSYQGAQKMAENNITAVLLPGAFYYLKETRKPPVRFFRELGIPTAVSSDLNPGSSPVYSMPLVLNMACMFFGLRCEEALLGATINGAKALGMEERKGSLETGKDADLVIWDIDRPADICYHTGISRVSRIMIKGKFYL